MSALDKENEKKLAEYTLYNQLKLGEIHLTNTSIGVTERHSKISLPMRVGGFVNANIPRWKKEVTQKIHLGAKK